MFHALIATLALAARVVTPAEDSAQVRREDSWRSCTSGGYSVLLRHARTDYSFRKKSARCRRSGTQQRNLSDDGIRDAALMGVVFRKYGIGFARDHHEPDVPHGRDGGDGRREADDDDGAPRAIPSTPEQEALIKTAPKPGTNRILVTHHFVIEKHVPGVKPG